MVFVDLEKPASESNDEDLKHYNNETDDPEQFAGADSAEEVELIFDSPAADEVEHL